MKSIFSMALDQFGFARQDADDVLGLACGGGLVDVECRLFLGQEISQIGLLVVGSHQDRAEAALLAVDQARVLGQQTLDFLCVALFDGGEKFIYHAWNGFPVKKDECGQKTDSAKAIYENSLAQRYSIISPTLQICWDNCVSVRYRWFPPWATACSRFQAGSSTLGASSQPRARSTASLTSEPVNGERSASKPNS